MKYYLDNIKNLILKYNTSIMYEDEMVCSGPLYLHNAGIKKEFILTTYNVKCKELFDWIVSKELFFDTIDLPESAYGYNITLYGSHVILSEKDKEFLFHLKLSNPELFKGT